MKGRPIERGNMLTNDLRSDAAAAGQGACGERDASRELRVQRHRQTLIWSRWALLWARSIHTFACAFAFCVLDVGRLGTLKFARKPELKVHIYSHEFLLITHFSAVPVSV